MLRIGFIGAGTVGIALAVTLNRKGYQFIGASRRSRKPAQDIANVVSNFRILDSNQEVADTAELVFITTPDAAIAEVAKQVNWRKYVRSKLL